MPAFTPDAIRLASIYFPILVECAKRAQVMTYSELVAAAKARHPSDAAVAAAVPMSTGSKLDLIKAFCKKSDLPDLASLVVSKQTGEAGDEYEQKHTASEAQRLVFEFDWNQKLNGFDAFVIDESKRALPLSKRKEDEARALLFAYYKEHKEKLPSDIVAQKPMLLKLLMEGHDAADAFDMVRANR